MVILTLAMCRHAVYSAFLQAQARKASWVERWHEACVCPLQGRPRRGGRQETWLRPAGQGWGWLQGARLPGKCRPRSRPLGHCSLSLVTFYPCCFRHTMRSLLYFHSVPHRLGSAREMNQMRVCMGLRN